ncbi:ANM_HP_G0109250.mRNA.1.CDS.1 [Saccharomyces cerevisiae]|nr:ANM_HP_G0109250.mRNA.1.CDS.1 [Saccharomyces cerevisiae]CAI6455130.1 ANM_HP_G0109250.mRNA.1.CDS.1 [Saccharomyces cerevisiae]
MYNSSTNHHEGAPTSGHGYYMSQQQDQQHQQQQYANEMNPYQQIPRPPAAGFSSNYMKEQGSHQSLQEHLQRETGNLGSGFTDVPALNYPATPPPHNNYAASNQMINTPPPSMGGLYRHNNNSQSMVQNSNGSGNAQLPQLSPGQYSIESEYNQNLNGSSSSTAVKLKIENFYQSSVKYAIERNERRVELETELTSHNWSEERKSRQLSSLGKKESQFLRLRRTRLSLEDFHTVKVIGKGAFGEVRLVQKKDTGKIYAMKTLLKSEMYKKDQLAHVKAERDVLAGSDSPWVVSLYYSFQDAQYLYLIMEFLPGGDLMTMLIRWQLFTEDVTRFYMAECILAIETIHKLGFIHRDIKPDNILIDIRGHIKLSDFGLSTGFHKTHDSNYYKKLLQQDEATNGISKPGTYNANTTDTANKRQTMVVDSISLTMSNRQQIQTWRKSRRLMAYSTVGTPDYIAPEIFLYQGYGQECDWWSLGAIMYECLIGWPPFCSETPQETYRKIMNFEQTLQFPDDIHISYEAEDLIRRLLTHADQRLGRHGGADEIKSHPFFRGVDWNTIRQVEAPYIPKLSSITDTRFFPNRWLRMFQIPKLWRDVCQTEGTDDKARWKCASQGRFTFYWLHLLQI